MDACRFPYALVEINDLSTVVSVGCVLPTYFIHLRPATYRFILFLGIVFGLSTWLIEIAGAILCPFYPFSILMFSPLNIVLIAILTGITRVTRVGLWSTVVLVCVIFDWVGIRALVWSLS